MPEPEVTYLPPHELEQFEDPLPMCIDLDGEWAKLSTAEDRRELWSPWWDEPLG